MATTISTVLTSSYFGSLAASVMDSVSRRQTEGTRGTVRTDPARWAMSQSATVDSHVLNVQLRTLSDDLSRHQTAETALSSVKGDLARLKEIVGELDAGTDLTETEVGVLETEFADLATRIDSTVTNTSYSEQALLDGSAGSLVDATAATGLALGDFASYADAATGVQSALDAMVTPELDIQGGLVPLQHQSNALSSQIEVLDGSAQAAGTDNQAGGMTDDVRNEILALVVSMLNTVSNTNTSTDRLAELLQNLNS